MEGNPEIDKYMYLVARAIKNVLKGDWSSEIYNRAYEAVAQAVEDKDKRIAELEAKNFALEHAIEDMKIADVADKMEQVFLDVFPTKDEQNDKS